MPKTKLDNFVQEEIVSKQRKTREPKERIRLSLIDIPDLTVTLTIEEAARVAGVGYPAIKKKIDTKEIFAIDTGNKWVIPTWEFIVHMRLFPERLLEEVYLKRIGA